LGGRQDSPYLIYIYSAAGLPAWSGAHVILSLLSCFTYTVLSFIPAARRAKSVKRILHETYRLDEPCSVQCFAHSVRPVHARRVLASAIARLNESAAACGPGHGSVRCIKKSSAGHYPGRLVCDLRIYHFLDTQRSRAIYMKDSRSST
jgi:hypothetical protein